jgi:hypothetical protein
MTILFSGGPPKIPIWRTPVSESATRITRKLWRFENPC